VPNALTSNRDGSTISALEALRNALYKFKTYLLTYLVTYLLVKRLLLLACIYTLRQRIKVVSMLKIVPAQIGVGL